MGAITSKRWAASNWNRWAVYVGIRTLAGLRLHNSAPARQAFSEYLGLLASSHRAYTTLRTGWHQVAGADVFVLPDGGIGGAGTEVVMQGVTAAQFHQAGDLNAWQNEISKLCLGNRLPAFAISAAFAAPLIELTGDASGGFHFAGKSQTGKTALLRIAGSVWGGGPAGGAAEFVRSWRSTTNALEATAAQHSDALLPLVGGGVNPRFSGA